MMDLLHILLEGICRALFFNPPQANELIYQQKAGARSCTPEAYALRDYHQDILNMGVTIFGVSTQLTDYQSEMVSRLHLPFDVLSDFNLNLVNALKLPTMQVNNLTLIKRLTMIVHSSIIRHVNYPVFPPDQEPINVISWLRINGN